MGKGILAKQLQRCLRNLHGFTDGQVQMVDCDWELLTYITIEVSPNDGIYKGNRYKFKIDFRSNYPDRHPNIYCLTNIYHPNIDMATTENGEGEGYVCVSLINEWTPSNTVEDIIMSILFLLYNPNLDDPLNEFVADNTLPGLEKMQEDIMKGAAEEHERFDRSKEAYQDLLPCEWDVLSEAANVAWKYTLEQEKWENEMKEDTWARYKPQNDSAPSPQRRNYAFGRSSMQRSNTVTVSCGQASSLDFAAPHKDTVLSWRQEEAFKKIALDKTEEEEEPMDCTQVPDTISDFAQTSRDDNDEDETPASLSWQPLCETDKFKMPSLRKTFTCI